MSSKTLNPEERTAKRARWESFEFAVVPSRGKVNVANVSYGVDEAGEHTYTVTVEDGKAVACTCPADEYHEGPCKHRTATEAQPAVLEAAGAAVTDGGGVLQASEECDACAALPGEFPCADCYISGRAEFPEDQEQ